MSCSGFRYTLPDGKSVDLISEHIRCTESLFQPVLAGCRGRGIADLAWDAIQLCDADRESGPMHALSQFILCVGGTTMIPGSWAMPPCLWRGRRALQPPICLSVCLSLSLSLSVSLSLCLSLPLPLPLPPSRVRPVSLYYCRTHTYVCVHAHTRARAHTRTPACRHGPATNGAPFRVACVGLEDRLKMEIDTRAGVQRDIYISQMKQPERHHAAFIGGSILAGKPRLHTAPLCHATLHAPYPCLGNFLAAHPG